MNDPEKPAPQTSEDEAVERAVEHQEELLDEALDESFPASDPPAPAHPDIPVEDGPGI